MGQTASSSGFPLPNADGDVRAPDTSFILAKRLSKSGPLSLNQDFK